MKRLMKLTIAVTLIVSMMALTASAFVPPGQRKKDGGERWLQNRARILEMHEARWDDEVLEEALYGRALPPGLKGKGIPPGLLKKGLVLPPGLAGRDHDDLPPGIIMRFLDAAERTNSRNPRQDEESEVDSIIVSGIRTLIIPNQGSNNVTYSAVVRDQYRMVMQGEDVVWELYNPDNIAGVTINEETGILTINDLATAGTIVVVAVSETDSDVEGELEVKLRVSESETTATVWNESELLSAIDSDVDVILLGESFEILRTIEIDRSLTIDGMMELLAPDEEFVGSYLINITAGNVKLENLYLDGFETETEKELTLVRVGRDAELEAENNILKNASVGFSFEISVKDSKIARQLIRANGFSNVEYRVGFYQ